jgi:hypothetical protein
MCGGQKMHLYAAYSMEHISSEHKLIHWRQTLYYLSIKIQKKNQEFVIK